MAVRAKKHRRCHQRGALVPVHEGMVLSNPVRVHGRQLSDAVIVACACEHHRGLEQATIAEAGRPAVKRETARWTDLGAALDTDLLLGELLADRTMKWVAFHEPAGFRVTFPRHLVAATAPLRRLHMDLGACVDETGLQFRWRGGRGGYNWRPHEVHPSFANRVLEVPLAPKVVQRPERGRAGAWVGQILQELGYIT